MNVHILRRSILKTLQDAGRRPMSAEEIVDEVNPAAAEKVEAQISALVTLGYVLNANNAIAPLYRITGAGLTQVTAETADLDPNIWGRHAVK